MGMYRNRYICLVKRNVRENINTDSAFFRQNVAVFFLIKILSPNFKLSVKYFYSPTIIAMVNLKCRLVHNRLASVSIQTEAGRKHERPTAAII